MRKGLTLLLLAAAIACRERGVPDPNVRMAVSHERASPETDGAGAEGSAPAKLVVPPEVVAAYSGIRIGWRDAEGGREGILDVPIGGEAAVPGSDLRVRAEVFLPAFTMSADEITSTGTAEENPAARVGVLQGGKEVFVGWIFKRFPDVHPFQHPRFSLRLEGGIPRTGA